MTTFKTHLSILEKGASLFSSLPVFKLPRKSDATGEVEEWISITYHQFREDVELVAKHWAQKLKDHGLPPRAVVGVWFVGWSYSDLLQIYGLSRAGYVPQAICLKLANPDVVYELLQKGNAKVLLYEPLLEVDLSNSPLPLYTPVDVQSISNLKHEPLSPLPSSAHSDDIVFIYHTSGSTSGIPKLIPCSYKWLDCNIDKIYKVMSPKDPTRKDVTVTTWMGYVCHLAQIVMFMGLFQHGGCVILPTDVVFSADELIDMFHRCHLTRLFQFGPFLSAHLRNSRSNPKLLHILKCLDEVLYGGVAVGADEEAWGYQNGILLRNLFGTSEGGPTLRSIGGRDSNAALLRVIEGVEGLSYGFFPVDTRAPAKSEHTPSNAWLELVILSQSRDCPHPNLRSTADGHFHTGDLFEEMAPGSYIYKGRRDDWVKTDAGRCDPKSIEDNVLATCPGLVAQCVAVGNGRPSLVLFVEPANEGVDHTTLKNEILSRTREFHSRRYVHEQITDAKMIIVVDRGTLPRTAAKGNIRRGEVEKIYKEQLDHLYGVV